PDAAADAAPEATAAAHVAAYTASAELVAAAFAAADPAGAAWLPEISTARPFPVPLARSFHLIDYVAHSWDVARTLGTTVAFDDDVLAEAVRVAELVPDDESRTGERAFFRPRLPVPDDAVPLDRFLLLLGRDPAWAPPA
ncbi:MAG TPA: hypothetical protein VGD67_21480, partial [Pseudonocardiaceae bacterium]